MGWTVHVVPASGFVASCSEDAWGLIDVAIQKHRLRMGGRVQPWEADDLRSDAAYGLLAAARSYDPSRGASFATFALHRMAGALFDGVRHRNHWRRTGFDVPGPVSLERAEEEGARVRAVADCPDPGDVAGEAERTAELAARISALRPADRDLLVSCVFGGATAESFAEGVTGSAVTHRLRHIIGRLGDPTTGCVRDVRHAAGV